MSDTEQEKSKLDKAMATALSVLGDGTVYNTISESLNALNALNAKPAQKECKWFQDEYNQSYYDTFCGQSWEFGDGDTVKNGMNYCHSCGGKVAEVKHKPELERAEIARPVTAWTSVDEFDYTVSHTRILAWARKMPMSMGSYEDGYFTLYDTEDCGIFEGDAEWFKDNFEFYMPSPLQPARSST